MDTLLISISEAANVLGIGRSKTYSLISEGLLETVSIGSRRLVKVDSVHRLVQQAALGEAA